MTKKNTLFLALITSFCVVAIIYTFFNRHERTVSNISTIQSKRSPASLNNFIDEKVLKDYFVQNHYQKTVRYEIIPHLWSDKDLPYIKNKLKETIQTSIINSFTADTELKEVLMANFIKQATKNFILTPAFYKILNGTFQIDIDLVPQKDSHFEFNNELSSNQLVRFDQTGTLLEQISDTDGDPTLVKNIFHNPIPLAGNKQFIGGSISIWFKILDMAFNPFKVPKPTKNAIKGYVRFRKFFRLNTERLNLRLKDKDLGLTEVYIKSKDSHIYYTADVLAYFNLEDFIPIPEEIKLYPTQIRGREIQKGSRLRQLLSSGSEPLDTARFVIQGEFRNRKFQTSVRSFSFSSNYPQKLKINLSRIKIDDIPRDFPTRSEEFAYKNDLTKIIHQQLSHQLHDAFDLDKLITKN